jgi:deoxyribodipyrimidine photo-lyase
MSPKTIDSSRVKILNDANIRDGDHVLYWMQQSQRAEYNHALEYAVQQANGLGQGVLVIFGLMDDYPEANLRHYTFMLEGLQETMKTLAGRGIKMLVRKGHPVDVVSAASQKASLVVCDQGYLRHQKAWRNRFARQSKRRVVQVESDVIVPVEVVSDKAEYAARTIRPKIHRHLEKYLSKLTPTPVKHPTVDLNLKSLEIQNTSAVLKTLQVDRSVAAASRFFKGGTSQAKKRFTDFMRCGLAKYDDHSNQPQTDDISHMSPYLHFGHISPLYLALEVKKAGSRRQAAKDAYMEELVVRRELAMNFANYVNKYDAFDCIPQWAQKTLARHEKDKREHIYTRKQLEDAQTHDEYWNAAMREMRYTGFMHNYMRMYWGKKIIEWSKTPQQAFKTTLALNNKYFLDGRDPNSFTGVAWLFGVHDRAWTERPVFGKIRWMAASGLERKCDIQAYVRKVDALVKRALSA